jgi:DNA polymerase I-like protein with 3'-5' exonuclease and polymerase domains
VFPAVLDRDALHTAVRRLDGEDGFCFDVESAGELRGHPAYNTVSWIALAARGFGCVIPMGHPNGDTLLSPQVRRKDRATGKMVTHPAVYDSPPPQLRREEVFEALAPLMFSDRLKSGSNLGFDLGTVAKYYDGRLPEPPYLCTVTGVWLLDENLRHKGLKDIVAARYQTVYDRANTGKCVERHAFSTVARYAYLDARYTWMITGPLLEDIHAAGLDELLELEMGVLPVVAKMRLRGAHVDRDALAALDTRLTVELRDAHDAVDQVAGRSINLNSPRQKAQLLYGRREDGGHGLKPVLLTDGGKAKAKAGAKLEITDYSTSSDALEPYADHPLVMALGHYQELEKLESTYVHAYLGDADEPGALIGERIHTDFVQYGTVTGRFSSRRPNLQNVPRPDNPLSQQVRGLFTAPDGWRLIVADYGQIELRVLGHYLGTGALYDGFHQGVDAHTATAALIFGVTWDEVTKEQRQTAKAINFAIVYGARAPKVAAMAKIRLREAEHFLRLHRKLFPEVYAFRDAVIATCRRRNPPHVKTLLGRIRRVPEINYRNEFLRSRAERQVFNSLIQGSAGDLIKLAMIRWDELAEPEMHLVLTVHDELVVEAPEARAEHAAALLREAMTGPAIQKLLDVPLTADIAACRSWSEAK